jgi:hypothetical protein
MGMIMDLLGIYISLYIDTYIYICTYYVMLLSGGSWYLVEFDEDIIGYQWDNSGQVWTGHGYFTMKHGDSTNQSYMISSLTSTVVDIGGINNINGG